MAGQSKCVSSQWNIRVNDGSYAHQYDVSIVFNRPNGRKQRILTKGGDACQKARCRHILKNFAALIGIAYAYDGQAILWTSKAIEDPIKDVVFEMDAYMQESLGNDEGQIIVTLNWVRSVDISDFSAYVNGDPNAVEDRTLRSVYEMILSQDALERNDGHRFASIAPGQLCEMEETQFDRGLVSRDGNSKGVHIIKSTHGPQPILALNSIKKVFLPSGMNLLTFLHQFMAGRYDYDEAARLLRGNKLQLTYNQSRTLSFKCFTEQPLRDLTVALDDGTISIEEYYMRQYNIQLERIDEPGAIMMQGTGIFPLEVLQILPDQSPQTSHLPENLREYSLRINRLGPEQRYNMITEQFTHLNMNNEITSAFGISIETNMIQGSFTRLNKMTIIARGNNRLQPNDFGVFRFDRNQYLIPGEFKNVIVLSSQKDSQASMQCAKAVVDECRRKGMVMKDQQWTPFNTTTNNMNLWIEMLSKYKNQKAIVFNVDSSRESHARLKLAEAMTGVPTQHLKWVTANQVARGKPQTLENIAHKINLKSGGLNHRIELNLPNLNLNNENILVIGLDCCHPTGDNRRGPTAEPTFVGITGNYLQDPCAFAGTFFLQAARQESVDPMSLRLYVTEMLKLASLYRKIDTIVLMRDGVSEGQYNMVITDELNAIQKAANDFFNNQKQKQIRCRLVGIVVTKSGNVRHFNISNVRPESLPPRSVVTFGTRENFSQFYMVPHRAFQCTAKAVMVTVLQDDIGLTDDETQKFVMGLTNLHQIVCAPVSLPEPIYQADKLAQRGQIIYRCFVQHYPQRIPRTTDGINFTQVTNLLSFKNGGNGELPLTRFTA